MTTAAKQQMSAFFFWGVLCIGFANAQPPAIEDLGPGAARKFDHVFPIPIERGLVYLSSLKPDLVKRLEFGPPFVGEYSVLIGMRWLGGEHSLSLHPLGHDGSAAARFPLDRKYDGLVGAYGFFDAAPREGSTLHFSVRPQRAWPDRIGSVTTKKPADYFAVSVKGWREVELWVDLRGFFEGTHAGWIEPLLVPTDFDLTRPTTALKNSAASVTMSTKQEFFKRAKLLELITVVRDDKKSLHTIQQARKAAIFRVGQP